MNRVDLQKKMFQPKISGSNFIATPHQDIYSASTAYAMFTTNAQSRFAPKLRVKKN